MKNHTPIAICCVILFCAPLLACAPHTAVTTTQKDNIDTCCCNSALIVTSRFDHQYKGKVTENSDTTVFVNLFHNSQLPFFKNWRNEFAGAYGGGHLYWTIDINITANSYRGFFINAYH